MNSSSTWRTIAFYDKDADEGGTCLYVAPNAGRINRPQSYSAPADGKVYVSCHKTYYEKSYAIIRRNDILTRNRDTDDVVYAASDFHRVTASWPGKLFTLLIAGDIHGAEIQMNSIVKYLNAKECFDAGIMLGDIASSNFTHSATYYTNAISKSKLPFLTVIGNHDAGNSNDPATSFTDPQDLYNKFIAPNIQYAQVTENTEWTIGNAYYYKDFSDYNIRVIVLNQYDHPATMDGDVLMYTRADSYYSQAQLTWFVNTLNSTPSGYGVIIAMHTCPDSMVKDFGTDFTSTVRGEGNLYDHSCLTGYPIVNIVNAWINGTTLSATYNYRKSYQGAETGATATVNADFTDRGPGELICYIGGHWHASFVTHSNSFSDQMEYSVDCASISTGATEDSDTPRKFHTKSEDCFCALVVDRTNKIINLVRIGAHMTNYMLDRFAGQIPYAVE